MGSKGHKAGNFLIASLAALIGVWTGLTLLSCGNGGGGGGGGGGGDTFLELGTHPSADIVIGQYDLTSHVYFGTPTQYSVGDGHGPEMHGGGLYVPDSSNHRVLGFYPFPAINNALADFVIGQTDFVSDGSGNQADEAYGPQGVEVYGGSLFVAMAGSHSVYIYDPAPIANGASADIVVGQTDFGIGTSGCTGSSLNSPYDLEVVDDKLIVSDRGNNRVLIWNSIPITNGVAADLVLGQANLTTCTAGTSATKMDDPRGVWSDGKRLLVSEPSNNRVLLWNTFPTTSGQAADVVIGQANMPSNASGLSDWQFNYPEDVYSNGTQIFVVDYNNSRVMVWDSFPTTNGASADWVVGQPDLTCGNDDENDGNCGTSSEAPGPKGLSNPTGVYATGKMLIVDDQANYRILIFRE